MDIAADAEWTGVPRSFPFPIEAGHVLAFARAIGSADTATVPPTFAAVADHFDPDFARRPHLAGAGEGDPRQGRNRQSAT